MMQGNTLDRRTFTVEAVLALLSGVAITVTGCGGGYSSSPSPPTPTPTPTPASSGDKVGAVSANHGHVATIVAAKITAGAAFDLDIRGSADHTHTVSVSAADLSAIAANQRVSKESTDTQSHSHTVTFN